MPPEIRQKSVPMVIMVAFLLVSLGAQGTSSPEQGTAVRPPSYSNLSAASMVAGTTSVFATRWADPSGLSQYVFSFDSGSGTLVNGTAMGLSGPVSWSNASVTLSSPAGTRVQWKVYAQDLNGMWNSTHTLCAVTGSSGSPSGLQYALIVDDCYDLLAYDGSHLFNLGSLPQLFYGDAGSPVGFHGIQWDSAMDTALMAGYNDALVKYSAGTFTFLATGLSSAMGLNGVAWRPGDNSFALVPGDGGVLMEYNGGTVTPITTGTTSNLKKAAWSTDGSYALVVGDGGTILKFTFAGRTLSSVPSGTGKQLAGVDFSPDGNVALIVGSGGTVLEYSGATSAISSPLLGVGPTYQFQDVRFSRDGAYALLTSQNNARGDLVMWKAPNRTFSNVTSGITNTANQVAFAPDDSYAYVTTTAGVLLKENYGASAATPITLTDNRLRGIDFFSSTPTITTTSTTASTAATTVTNTLTTQTTTTATKTTTTSRTTVTSSSSSSGTTSTRFSTTSPVSTTAMITTAPSTSLTSAVSSALSSGTGTASGSGGGISEFPVQAVALMVFIIVAAVAYLVVRIRGPVSWNEEGGRESRICIPNLSSRRA